MADLLPPLGKCLTHSLNGRKIEKISVGNIIFGQKYEYIRNYYFINILVPQPATRKLRKRTVASF
jgi:hypothetical protein